VNPSEELLKNNSLTDPELMLLVQQRDDNGFEILMRRHEDRVFRLAHSIIGQREDARDVAQEVFIKIWESPHAWKPKALFTTWLYRVTMNRALWKKRGLKLKSIIRLSDIEPEQLPITNSRDLPEEHIIHNETIDHLETELHRLPDRQRIALHFRYREELSVKDVAISMGVSLKSAESLIFRAKKTLKERMIK
jgi:RNA polymerase sigma factor (sigma-70 family)